MRALQILREEHGWIERMLDCLQRVLELAQRSGRLEAEVSAELLALFAYFAEGVHQRREEGCLFPRLLARAHSIDQRLALGRLYGDHERERTALRLMGERLLGAIYGDGSELQDFLREGWAFLGLHRQHLAHENRELLPLAESLLLPQDDELLLAGFRDLEHGRPAGPAIGQRVFALCTRLALGSRSASQF
jgi:hemerythrin-like domain-containing protein